MAGDLTRKGKVSFQLFLSHPEEKKREQGDWPIRKKKVLSTLFDQEKKEEEGKRGQLNHCT